MSENKMLTEKQGENKFDIDADIAYFKKKLEQGLTTGQDITKVQKRIDELEEVASSKSPISVVPITDLCSVMDSCLAEDGNERRWFYVDIGDMPVAKARGMIKELFQQVGR